MYEEDGKDDIGALKNVLPLMSRHASGYHPVSYAVWYEYAKGANLELKKDVEAELQFRERLTGGQTYAIYAKHLLDPAERSLLDARTGLLGLVTEVRGTVRDADLNTSGLDSKLVAFEQDVSSARTLVDLKGNISAMLTETRRASEGLVRIAGELEHSRSEVERLEQELRNARLQAQADSLTGLLNRRGFDLELERLQPNHEAGGLLSLVMLDIDHFKTVNDTYGHPLGDAVISAVGQFIRDCVGAFGVAARYGGEEFAVVLAGKTLDEAAAMAEKIRARVEQGKIKRRKDDQAIGGITISAGVARWRPGEHSESLVDRADAALYAAKAAGRNRIEVDRS